MSNLAIDTIIKIKNTQGNINKANVLSDNIDNEELKQILYYTYNPFIVFGVAKKKLEKKLDDKIEEQDNTLIDIISVLKFLEKNNTGKDVILYRVQKWLKNQPEIYQDIYKDIICKTLTIGMNVKSINKIFPNLIPTYEVQQGEKWFDYIDKLANNNERVIITQKFDGQRCSCRVENGNVVLFSRNGKVYSGLKELESELSLLPNGMYDGELLLQINTSNQETDFSKYIYHPLPSKELFKRTSSIVNSDSENKTGISIWLYDYTPLENFDNMLDYELPTIERKQYINKIIISNMEKRVCPHIHQAIILYEGVFNHNLINNMLDDVLELEQEGLMINLSKAPYEFKRSRNMLKVKKMYPVDLLVEDIEEGSGQNKNRVGALIVNYKGYKVKVGSGITQNQRIEWWNNPSKIIGKIIEVQYFEETTNKKDNSLSLRFPVFKRIREDKDEESYN